MKFVYFDDESTKNTFDHRHLRHRCLGTIILVLRIFQPESNNPPARLFKSIKMPMLSPADAPTVITSSRRIRTGAITIKEGETVLGKLPGWQPVQTP